MFRATIKPTRRRPSGLATLELILSLPILLMIMALMVNFGNVACWKVRGLSVARHEAWRARRERIDYPYPRPDYWPAEAASGLDAEGNLPALDDPRVNQPVARGPFLMSARVNADLLDPTRGLRHGWAALDRRFPMLGNMGRFHLRANNYLLDDKWQFHEMENPQETCCCLPSNSSRRTPCIYLLPQAPPGLIDAYVQAARAIFFTFYYYPPLRDFLAPLDNDDEFRRYGPLVGCGVPDFHPRLSHFCTLDREIVEELVEHLIDRIEGNAARHVSSVAERMARAFIRLYERVIAYYRNILNQQPPPSAAVIASLQAEIAQLQQKIAILNRFLQKLSTSHGG